MKRLIRYKKKIVSLMCAVMVISIGIFSTSFESKAEDVPTFYLPISEPTKSETQGYIILLLKHSESSVLIPYVYFWNMISVLTDGEEAPIYAYITLGDNSFEFVPAGNNTVSSVYYSIFQVDSNGRYAIAKYSNTERYSTIYSGYEIVGWQYAGNVGYINKYSSSIIFNCYFDENGSSALINDILYTLSLIHNVDFDIFNKVNSILSSVDGLENQLSSVISYLQSIDSELDSIKSELQEIYNKADEIFDEEKKQTTWLGKIWESIQEFIKPKSDDEEAANDFNAESGAQKSEIDSLNQQNHTEKVDVNSATSQVDSNINYDNMAEYGGVLATITNNNYVLQMILIVVSVAIIAYVLFGKR